MTGLLHGTRLDGEQQDYVNTIRNSGEALLGVINDILDFSKIEAGEMEVEKHTFGLRECVESALDIVAPRAAEKKLDLMYQIEEGVPGYIESDPTRLRQVLVNLMNNAIKFTHAGEVFVQAQVSQVAPGTAGEPARFEIHFLVRDTGIGIPAERMDRLFRSFSQIDASTTRKYGGTGLGLAISKRLVEMMGGRVWVDSVVGEGSTFHFTILAPAAPPLPKAQRGGYTSSLGSGLDKLQGKRALVVDDNATNRRILLRQLASWGMEAREATSALEALELLQEEPGYSLAILDLRMPEIDGYELATLLREKAATKNLPLILTTSLGVLQSEIPMELGFRALVHKPLKPDQVLQAVKAALDGTALARSTNATERVDSEMGRRHPLQILLAEDNPVNQKVALGMLRRLGYEAKAVVDGLAVVERCMEEQFDLVLMDVQMPVMDGVEATRRLREELPRKLQPYIVALTANALQGDREAYLAAGMDDYLSKPLTMDALMQALDGCEAGLQAEGFRVDEINDMGIQFVGAISNPAGRGNGKRPVGTQEPLGASRYTVDRRQWV